MLTIAIAKAAGYYKWFNATGADMAKLKAGKVESLNHFVDNARGKTTFEKRPGFDVYGSDLVCVM